MPAIERRSVIRRQTMTDVTIDSPSHEPQRRSSFVAIVLPPLLLFAAMIMAADFTAISLRPIHALRIPYLKAMDYAHFIIPGFCAAIWLASLRKWPTVGSIVAVVLCFALVDQIPGYAARRTSQVPVRRWLESEERQSFESRNGFAIFQMGSTDGLVVIVAPEHAVQARDDLNRLGLVSSRRPAAR